MSKLFDGGMRIRGIIQTYESGRETTQSILEAARELFAERGYDGASIRAITARAGVNLGAVTYHFGTKERLYLAVSPSRPVPSSNGYGGRGRVRSTRSTGSSRFFAAPSRTSRSFGKRDRSCCRRCRSTAPSPLR